MNKFVKLPLFLGVCGAICAGVLGIVNGITAPIIEKRLENERNANYLELMGVEAADEFKDGTVSDDLKGKNVTGIKEIIVGGEVLGVVYDGTVADGFTTWTLQLGIKEGSFTGLKYTNSEADAIGKTHFDAFASDLAGKSIDFSMSDVASGVSSMSTNPALRTFASACAADFAANYQ